MSEKKSENYDIVVRKLTKEDKFEACLISTVAFHGRIENVEEKRARVEADTTEDWGAFHQDGTMMARIMNSRFSTYIDGSIIANGGIGAVSTLPEYRNTGAVKAIFLKLLPEAYQNGEVISTLYPFNHAFYRKVGYETVCQQNNYEFPPEVLRGYRFMGKAVLWKTGDSVSEYTRLYNKFAKQFNFAVERNDELMLEEHVKGEYYKDRKFCYLLYENEEPVAYLIFQDVHNDPQAILRVEDIAWDGRNGFLAILGFLSRFSADYGKIQLYLPMGVELLSLIHSPMEYDIHKTTRHDYMVRVINAQKLLEAMHKPAGTAFTIQVSDEIIAENNGTWLVRCDKAERTSKAPDIIVSERALAQMATGAVDLDEAFLRSDVTICSNEEALRSVFVRKKILIAEHF